MTEEPTEPPVEEEEEELPDNTTNRNDILNSQPKDYNEWIEYINNLEITVPDVQDIDFNDEEEIFAHIPIIIDACQYIYNTRNYRLESYANILQSKYKALEDEINNDELLTPEDKEQQLTELSVQKGDELKVLNTDYLNKSFVLAKEMKALKAQTKTETGFIGDVYIEGKLNNHDVSEYVLKEQLDTKADKEHGHDFNVIQDTLTLNMNGVNVTVNIKKMDDLEARVTALENSFSLLK